MHINRNYVPAKPEELHSYERHDEQQQKNVNRLQRTYVSFDKRTDAIRKANKQSKPIELINQQCVMRVIIIKWTSFRSKNSCMCNNIDFQKSVLSQSA